MKTYKEERKELSDWINAKNEEYIEFIQTNITQGRDSDSSHARRQVVEEYNRKLMELKKKYGIEEPESAEPATKARKFNQTIHPLV